jgi:cell division protein FtsI (penicillin-binding protein 3)
MDRKKELLWRAYWVTFFFVAASLVILFKIFKLSVLERDKWKQKGEVNVQWRTVDADRGNIYAEEETLLATSVQFFEVRMDMKVIRQSDFNANVDSLAIFLSNFNPSYIRPKSAAQWKTELIAAKRKENRYFYIAKGLDIDAFNQLKNAPLLRMGKYKGGLIYSRYGKRVKPYKELASRTIGVDRENADRIGLEGYFDKFLKGETDQRLMKRLSPSEDIWVPVYDPSEVQIKRGDDIMTTINIGMQDIVHHELLETCQKYNAEGGTVIMMETATGAIKAISNLAKAEDGNYYEIYNWGVGRLSEPGSTMKLATVLALMEDGYAGLDTMVNLNFGLRKFADRTMHDSEKHGKTWVTMQQAFEISSNVGIAALANDAYNSTDGRKKWVERLRAFGLHEPTGIDISGEAIPEIKDPVKDKQRWYGTTIPWMAHGYELQLTPLQMLNFYNAVANNGRLMKPYLVSEIRNGDKVKKVFEPRVLIDRIAKDENIRNARTMLEGVVERGTAKSLKDASVSIAGKTGTTRVNYASQGEYARYNASFCGYFPAEDPMYSMIVVVYEPKGVYYGGYVAGPVFKNIAEKCYALKTNKARSITDSTFLAVNLPGSGKGYRADFTTLLDHVGLKYNSKVKSSWAIIEPEADKMVVEEKRIAEGTIPDVRGMGGRDAVYVLENIGCKVSIVGLGKVVQQSVQPGTGAMKQHITLYLN